MISPLLLSSVVTTILSWFYFSKYPSKLTGTILALYTGIVITKLIYPLISLPISLVAGIYVGSLFLILILFVVAPVIKKDKSKYLLLLFSIPILLFRFVVIMSWPGGGPLALCMPIPIATCIYIVSRRWHHFRYEIPLVIIFFYEGVVIFASFFFDLP